MVRITAIFWPEVANPHSKEMHRTGRKLTGVLPQREVTMKGNDELREKIDAAKRQRLPLPELMTALGHGERAKKSAHCPLHGDEHKSFSVFKSADGFWRWKCFTGCGEGDEIMFLRKLKGLSLTEAMNLYLSMAGFPSRAPRKSHKYPQSPKCPECPESPSSPEPRKCREAPKSPV